jgi:hypothetical protein
MVLSNKAAARAQAEWVLVGGKESKSVERGWVIVPDKSKDRKSGPIVEEPERADKVLARCVGPPTAKSRRARRTTPKTNNHPD